MYIIAYSEKKKAMVSKPLFTPLRKTIYYIRARSSPWSLFPKISRIRIRF